MDGVWVEAVEVEVMGLFGHGDKVEMLLEADADDDSMAGMEIYGLGGLMELLEEDISCWIICCCC